MSGSPNHEGKLDRKSGDRVFNEPASSRPSLHSLLNVLQTLQRCKSKSLRKDNIKNTVSLNEIPSLPKKPKDAHLEILNALALIFVTAKSGDAAAVATIVNPSDLELILAKNTILTDKDREYIDELTEIVRETTREPHKTQTTRKVFPRILIGCRDKIIARMMKVQAEIRSNLRHISQNCRNDLERFPNGEKYRELIQDKMLQSCFNLRDLPLDKLPPLTKVLPQMLEGLLDFSQNCEIKNLRTVVWVGYCLGSDTLVDLVGPALVRGLKKLGDYYLSARLILYYASKPAYKSRIEGMKIIDTLQYCDPIEDRKFKPRLRPVDSRSQSPSPSNPQPAIRQRDYSTHNRGYVVEKKEALPITVLGTLNAVAGEIGVFPITCSNIVASYPEFVDNPWYFGEGDLSVHYQCRLAHFLTKRFPNNPNFEIGVSKSCCWTCDKWLHAYTSELGATSSRLTTFHESGIRDKVYRNWLSPGSARSDSSTYDEVFQRVKYELYAIKRRARSDSPESAIFVGDGTEDGGELDEIIPIKLSDDWP
ncbi:hypothetical protein AOL_s00007g323 [Orbilia oligospora ATCC 24927]|uniref:Uncharacterized protein n=1 Tax=Arthrobotrys oligospora (strain ATCC 24927 / CBS 115.81 / DSM 1491) TaxID=756982 RepID=G1X214_ARTOA|nr:hypothetical protein AOL_s00007g323 [Orbilia oligospora ATCC 24927]EGX52987.1 hypothetical protein AOL_s00007g323 [Orbilia oligospora ATCC 24927]